MDFKECLKGGFYTEAVKEAIEEISCGDPDPDRDACDAIKTLLLTAIANELHETNNQLKTLFDKLSVVPHKD